YPTTCAICIRISTGKRLDYFGTEIPCWRNWRRMGTDLAGAAYYRGPRDMVLSGKVDMATSACLHLSAVGDQFFPTTGLFATRRRVGRTSFLMAGTCQMEPRYIFCRCLLRCFAVPSAWIFQRLFLSLLICERSFSIFSEHGAAGARGCCDNSSCSAL